MSESEAAIQSAIRTALGRMPDVMLMRNANGSPIPGAHYGLPKGSADLIGVLAVSVVLGGHAVVLGRYLALEVKTPTGRIRPEQLQHLAAVRRFGGFGAVVRSVEEAVAAVERARKGETE